MVLMVIGILLGAIGVFFVIFIGRIFLFSKTARDYNIKGHIAWKLNRDKKAIKYFQKAIELNSDDVNTYLFMGSSYVSTDKYEEAIQCFQKVIELEPFYPSTYYFMGLIYEKLGNQVKADEYYKTNEILSNKKF